jgi:predicted permease
MDGFSLETRQAGRRLLASPGFAVAAILTLALGIGVNATIFSAARALLLATLPVGDPDRLVAIYQTEPGVDRRPVAPANFFDWRRDARSFAAMASYNQEEQIVAAGDEPRKVDVASVSANFFDVLATRALAGRTFSVADRAQAPVVVVSESFWRDELGGGEAVGRKITLDGAPVEIVGVAPASFDVPPSTRVWWLAPKDVAPLGLGADLDETTLRDARYLGVFARLAPGATLESARAEMTEIARRLAAAYPDANADNGIRVEPLGGDLGREARRPLGLLAAGAACVLAVAIANVAGLVLARSLARRREVAVRAALGAGAGRQLAHLLAETAWIAGAGAALGLAVAHWGAPWLAAALPGAALAGRSAALAPGVVGFGALAAIVAALAAAVAAGRAGRRASLAAALVGARGSAGPDRGRGRALLVGLEIALAVVLVSSTALLMRSLLALESADPGFRSRGAVVARLSLPAAAGVDGAARRAILDRAVAAAAQAPGVAAAGGVLKLPLSGASYSANATVEGREVTPSSAPDVCWRVVTPGYFAAMGIALEAGREVAAGDRAGAPPVAWVNATLARSFWPGESALGRRLRTGLDGEEFVTVAGVVADTPQESPALPARPEMYRPLTQENRYGGEVLALVARTGPGFSWNRLQAALAAAAPGLVVDRQRPLADLVRSATSPHRLLGTLLGAFAALALALAALGLHGLMALVVAERRREFGVRLAVGATARQIFALVFARAGRPALAGAAAGLAAAFAVGRALSSWLYRVAPWDPWSLGATLVLLAGAAFVAGWFPAWRAAATDPIAALHED